MAWHHLPLIRTSRQTEADLMRECAYRANLAELDAGAITLDRAVINLRYAYRRAEHYVRSIDTQTGVMMSTDAQIETQEIITVGALRRAAERARQRSGMIRQSAQHSDDPSVYRRETAQANHYHGLADVLDHAANMMETAP